MYLSTFRKHGVGPGNWGTFRITGLEIRPVPGQIPT